VNRNILVLVAAAACLPNSLNAQCSDAGVCSIGHPSEPSAHTLSLSYGFGTSAKADSLTFHSVEAAANFEILDGGRLSVGIPFNSQSGPLGSVSGIGDLTILWSQILSSNGNAVFGFQAGAKIALANVNNGDLPQAYQSGLGTNDLLLGMHYEVSGLNVALAYQHSAGRSDNKATRLKRGDDLLVRGGYTTKIDAVRLTGEVLAIKRLHTSNVITSAPGQPETFADLPNSDQAQVNLVARGLYPVSDGLNLALMAAVPLLKRDVNVDGLTRSIALSAGLTVTL